MSLFVQQFGQGPRVVLIHGWGLHGGVFEDLAARLAVDHAVIVPDLPGHGRSPDGPLDPDDVSRALMEQVGGAAVWLGWSLGALVALSAARQFPEQVIRLVLVGATPKFVQAADWRAGMAPEVFAEFTASLAHDHRATLLRFLSLQAGRDIAGQAVVRQLRTKIFAHGEPSPDALRAGLEVLANTDARAALPGIATPTLIVQGEHDRIAAPAAADFLAAQLPSASLLTVPSAGHAPFLSHPQLLEDSLRRYFT